MVARRVLPDIGSVVGRANNIAMRFAFPVMTSSFLLPLTIGDPHAVRMDGLLGCSSSPTCSDYSPPASFNAQAPSVAFAKDVMPIFGRSCTFSTCHGAGSSQSPTLGGPPTAVHDALVGIRASELPAMSYATPGDPRSSYLMRKMDGSNCTLTAQCVGGDCGESMPRGESTLSIDARDTVRRWIAQGANND
jgi:hypothetical protein